MKEILNKTFLIIAIFILVLTFSTHYYGSTDVGDYSDSAKYLSGKYRADIRISHSFIFGFMHKFWLLFFDNFLIFKITSVLFLFLIVLSVYKVSKDKKAFYLVLLSPAVWYMAPWISPIQLASLLLFWSYYFIDKFENNNNWVYLSLSGILVGLGLSVWNTILFLGIFLAFSFLYNKNFYYMIIFIFSIILGLIPLFILDYSFYNFAFYSLLKITASNLIATFFGGIYGIYKKEFFSIFINYILYLIVIPLYFWKLYRPDYFKKNKKSMFFISLSLLLFLSNPQLRYLLSIIPIMVLLLSREITPNQFKRSMFLSIIVILLIIWPYAVQIKYNINDNYYGADITEILYTKKLILSEEFTSNLIKKDLHEISLDFPNQVFVVGNNFDGYQLLADSYWGKDINEFVSMQDYTMYLDNQTVLFEKVFSPAPNINDRRRIWVSGGIKVNGNNQDYKKITMAIGINNPFNSTNFSLVKKYNILYLSKKNGK